MPDGATHTRGARAINNALGPPRQPTNGRLDPCSSAPYFKGFARVANEEGAGGMRHAAIRAPSPVHAAQTWLLTTGWRRQGVILAASLRTG